LCWPHPDGFLQVNISLLPLLRANIVTHHGVSQRLNFSEMFFLVFGDKKVSWIPEGQVGISGPFPIQTSNCHVTTRVFFVTVYKKCTQTLKIIPYQSFRDTIPVPTVARVHLLSSKLWYKILPASVAMLFCWLIFGIYIPQFLRTQAKRGCAREAVNSH
jgi:hypothetical protein